MMSRSCINDPRSIIKLTTQAIFRYIRITKKSHNCFPLFIWKNLTMWRRRSSRLGWIWWRKRWRGAAASCGIGTRHPTAVTGRGGFVSSISRSITFRVPIKLITSTNIVSSLLAMSTYLESITISNKMAWLLAMATYRLIRDMLIIWTTTLTCCRTNSEPYSRWGVVLNTSKATNKLLLRHLLIGFVQWWQRILSKYIGPNLRIILRIQTKQKLLQHIIFSSFFMLLAHITRTFTTITIN